MTHRTFLIALFCVFLVAFALRVGMAAAFVGLNATPDAGANPDQLDYEMLAYRMSIGEGYTLPSGEPTARRSPGTSLALLPAYVVSPRAYWLGRVWFCLLSAATCLAVGALVVQLVGRGHALLAAACMSLWPGHVMYAMHFVSETPYCLAMALAVALSLRAWQRGGGWPLLAAGACWAFAMLTRPQLGLVIPLAALLLAVAARWLPRDVRRAGVKQFAIQTCVALAVLSPWLARNAVHFGKPAMAHIVGHSLWGSHNEWTFNDPNHRGDWVRTSELERAFGALPADEVAKDKEALRRGMASIRENASQIPALIAWKLARFVQPFMDTPNRAARWALGLAWLAAVPFAIVGTWQVLRRRRAAAFVIALPVLATLGAVVLFYGSVRFRESLGPLIVVTAAIGVAHVASKIRPQWFDARDTATEPHVLRPVRPSRAVA